MLTATAEVIAFFNTHTTAVITPLLTITLRDGTVYRWARAKQSQTFGGVTWLAHGQGGRPLIARFRTRRPVGLDEIGVAEVVLECGSSAVLGSRLLTLAAASGAFEGATLLIEKAYAETPLSAIVGKRWCFSGRIEEAPPTSHSVTLSVQSVVARMKGSVLPRTLVSKTCGNALYDEACGVSRVANTITGTVAAGSTRQVVQIVGSYANDHWNDGSIEFTSGVNVGISKGIRTSSSPGAVELAVPLVTAPSAGDTIKLALGCDRTTGPAGCRRFDNLLRFRGCLHIPKEA